MFRISIYEFDQLGKEIHIIYNIIWSLTVDAPAEFLNLCKYFWALRKFNRFFGDDYYYLHLFFLTTY